ncbi:hypothetical protein [Chromobacterium vaccinii]|uniref:hypothetical protein n=1 Tax=Chromobacterium vaccinii TaxID=1108595 RepID=UPI000E18B228|nr:hypothetical protein [Chromobacterium vaccinii]SUX30692.1 Uncharacterised protein [Chromobacterium vaccinii]
MKGPCGPDRFELSHQLWKAIDLAEGRRDCAAVSVCKLIQGEDEEGARLVLERVFQPASDQYDELRARVSALVKSWKEEQEQPR